MRLTRLLPVLAAALVPAAVAQQTPAEGIPVTEVRKALYPVIDLHARNPAEFAAWVTLMETAGFCSGGKDGEPHDLLRAVRSKYPFSRRRR